MAGEFVTDNALDALCQYIIDNTEDIHVCSAAPANFAGIAAVDLGSANVTPGAVQDGVGSGRRTAIPQVTGLSITATDTATHVALADTTGTELIAVTDLSASQAVTSGNTATVATWNVEVADPTID